MTPTTITPTAAETATRGRRVYSRQEKVEYLALFEQGGMTPTDFCREMGLNAATFSQWRRAAREHSEGAAPQFAQVQVSAPKRDTGAAAVTLHLPRGARLEVNVATDAVWRGLGLLLETLHR